QYGYKSREGDKDKKIQTAPLLIGHLVPGKSSDPPVEKSNWAQGLVPFFFLMIVGTFIVVFVMTWGFRRADRRVLARVESTAPPFEDMPESLPVVPPAPETREGMPAPPPPEPGITTDPPRQPPVGAEKWGW